MRFGYKDNCLTQKVPLCRQLVRSIYSPQFRMMPARLIDRPVADSLALRCCAGLIKSLTGPSSELVPINLTVKDLGKHIVVNVYSILSCQGWIHLYMLGNEIKFVN